MKRFGIIGCGKIAQRHANLLGKNEIEGATLSAVCDVNSEKADKFAKDNGVKAFYDAQEMLKSGSVDVVSILTPSGFHARNILEIVHHGKPIVVEKPMALRLNEADEVIEACDKHKVKLFIVKQNRFNRPVMKLREAVENGRFGRLILGTIRLRWCRPQAYYDEASWRGTWAHDGGVLTNQASHHIDLLVWMMGEVESVFAKTTTALANIEAEDTAVVTIKFRNGALGVIEATTAARPRDLEGSLSVMGEKGSVVVGGFAANKLETWQFEEEEPSDAEIFETHGCNPSHPFGYSHKAYYEHVVDCIVNDRRQLVDGLGGRKSLELITAIYESVETGREIPLRFNPKKCRLGLG
ncbi:Gfo/Idh/MocA family oxidoreductase [Verrucomicrobia bacterium]|nr:Gfo/Idh/MocA family oxidoreductase [Verrucomicrobiota bacterium]